ncbi:hypothetical protein ACFSQQ_07040 [Mesorhizobium kowhaii]|uniref:SnoaL-like domain-containing protein n=1 Tax=Mesorhizobium kowhaii TaxID=1300272 RepID=A0A2W7C306_9HYPH|nr:hypothetical protein [Mesorhizobium kowhaii]PZV36731.1 hypothetical protein B5V02_20155 [Mesorhizobium kowhaii]
MTGPLETVKKALQAYVDKDRALIDSVIGRPHSFTSPLDNALSREIDFERCWLSITSHRLPTMHI